MADSETTKRPVRKLTVKNFSVIKEAELEFGKITVLIGPQASGKSLLCKLAYFFSRDVLLLAVRSASRRLPFDSFQDEVAQEFSKQFSDDSRQAKYFSATYSSAKNWISADSGMENNSVVPSFDFSPQFREVYLAMVANLPDQEIADISQFNIQSTWWVVFSRLFSTDGFLESFYIPAGRAFFTNATLGFSLLQNPGIDSITRNFAAQIQWDPRWKIGMLTLGREIPDQITRSMTDIAQGFVMSDSGVPRFLSLDGQRKLPLELLSSGTQELVPLFNVVEQFMFLREHNIAREGAVHEVAEKHRVKSGTPFLYVEEPEANVFPSTQFELVRLFSWLSTDPILDFSWVITTHSPYILSAFGNLLKAGKVGSQSAEHRAAVDKVIPEQYWIKEGDFAAYKIENGTLVSIFDEKTGQIDGDYLDDVSGKISDEFGQLLEIQYGH